MKSMDITPKLLEKIVNEQKVSGLGLVTPDGRPHTTPVWTHHHDGFLYIFSRSERAKVRYARLNNDCMIAFDFASLRGKIDLFYKESPEYQKVKDLPDARYGDNDQLDTYKENWDVVLRIRPTKLYR